MNIRRGRPCKSGSKRNVVKFRIGEDERIMLDYLVERTGKSMSEIIRKSIRASYNLEKYKE